MRIPVPRFSALELDTENRVEGFYYLENGYWINNGEPDYSQPVQRHKIVDEDGQHRDIAECTLIKLDEEL